MSEKAEYRVVAGPYKGQTGTLIGDVDYVGCRSGRHTLLMQNTEMVLVTGDEVTKIHTKDMAKTLSERVAELERRMTATERDIAVLKQDEYEQRAKL